MAKINQCPPSDPSLYPGVYWTSGVGGFTASSFPSSATYPNTATYTISQWPPTAAPQVNITEDDIKIRGRSMSDFMERVEDRLAIVTNPDPVKLAKFQALKNAYDHYRLLEKLLGDEENPGT